MTVLLIRRLLLFCFFIPATLLSQQGTSSGEQQTSLSEFNFYQPFHFQVYALGCGIGCPIYRFGLNPDFSAIYEGVAFVKDKSKKEFLLTPENRLAVRELLGSSQFLSLDKQPIQCQHQSNSKLRYRVVIVQGQKQFQTMVEQHCHDAALKQLEQTMAQVIGRWKGRENQVVK